MKKIFSFMSMVFAITLSIHANYQPKFSTAGFFQLSNTGREVFSMNPAWRMHKGHVKGAEKEDFNDKDWKVCSLPDGTELLPSEGSGCVNFQGETWYRKHFKPQDSWRGSRLSLYFEAIMGKSKVWINGKLLKEQKGGYLPVIIDVTNELKYNEDNVITVVSDNSDDASYPPGKFQDVLDFTYAGGIYRDCWLVKHGSVFITDPNEEDIVAGGGLFVAYDNVSEKSADIILNANIRNAAAKNFKGKVQYELIDKTGNKVASFAMPLAINSGSSQTVSTKRTVKKAHLWSPDDPYLYKLNVLVKDNKGKTVDGYYQRIGIRSFEFKGAEGFWLNGKPYPEPLIGANRHQDYAVIGNALSNSLHWRDAKKLRDAGLRVIRNAHYPQDPAFMDACDELGLFVIINTPGWQFWNNEPQFTNYVYRDIRNMVRRDRNRPSVWLWEPILNETWYPDDFAKKVKDIVHEEYPYSSCYCACDLTANGNENYDIQFTHPIGGEAEYSIKKLDPKKTYFTREWGDNPDDWNAQNSPSRVSRAWGEVPMLVQAETYAHLDYPYTTYDVLYSLSRQHVGGCLWHSFDHQRGYHPDPFYGGIMDYFRQPKLSYYMFCAQRSPQKNENLIAESGPMVYIANSLTPFSPSDITVYSNCDEVRLTYAAKGKTYNYVKKKDSKGMPSPIIVFKDVFHFVDDKTLAMNNKAGESYLLAEGIIDGKVVATHKVRPARRPTKLVLNADNEGMEMIADGSDLMTIVASVSDDYGTVKRLSNQKVIFNIEGPGTLVTEEGTFTNPRDVQWGTAPIIVRSTTEPGTIKIRASVVWKGKATPIDGTIEIKTVKPSVPLVMDENELKAMPKTPVQKTHGTVDNDDNSVSKERLKEVEKQQHDFM